jgi:hypothetical protein
MLALMLSALVIAQGPPSAELELLGQANGQITVVVFLGVNCPLSKLYTQRLNSFCEEYGQRVHFVALISNRDETTEEIRAFVKQHQLSFPVLPDVGNKIADRLHATRNPEVVVLDASGKTRYQGRIDDQYAPGSNRPKPSQHFLRDAVAALFAGKAVDISATAPVGCLIDRRNPLPETQRVTYSKDIAPILFRRCLGCHRPGQVAPFSLTNYRETVKWADTIREVIADGRMPPWGADPRHGQFANDPRLSAQEKQLLFDWLEQGSPEGDPKDLPPAPSFPADGWCFKPDAVYSISEPFVVPAEGILDYQKFIIDPGVQADSWIRAIQIRPGNAAVVHHATLRAKPKSVGGTDAYAIGPLQDAQLAMFVPGQPHFELPAGMAKRFPKGWVFILDIHYVTIGSAQKDQTQIGIAWAAPDSVRKEVATTVLEDFSLKIPPFEPNHVVRGQWQIDRNLTLLALFPHMHWRGKSMIFVAYYPDGTEEILLNVPSYDFNWQHRYVLQEPKLLAAGTVVCCTGVFDNSADNPANPDPSVYVRQGLQTTDEMFQGYFEMYATDADSAFGRLGDQLRQFLLSHGKAAIGFATLGIIGLLLRQRLLRYLRRQAPAPPPVS